MKEATSKKPVSNTCYTIAAKDGRVLEVADFDHASGAAVQLWESTGVDSQKWLAVEVAEGVYKLENKLTGKVPVSYTHLWRPGGQPCGGCFQSALERGKGCGIYADPEGGLPHL